ncbi:MAG: SRPBCC domain-containing protein [Acidimicrobiia bacterium]|nr:SRPBCC domain-containing protein [Acidimicrobiia bacterium]
MERRERFEIDIQAGREAVWERLTTAEGLASWFGTWAEIDLRIGGERVVGWGDVMQFGGTISDLEPGRRIRVVYVADGESTGAEEWLLTHDRGVTRLTLIQSISDDGIDDWDGFFGDVRRGWGLFMASMRHGLEGAAAANRTAECVYIPAPMAREEIWRRVQSALAGAKAVEGLVPALVIPPHSRLLVASDRTLLLDAEGSGDGQVLYAQAATHGDWVSEQAATWRRDALEFAAKSIDDA